MKKNYLLLFTDFFPFGNWESFLLAEMKFLPKYFDRIFILSNYQGSSKPLYELSQNTEALFISQRISSFEKISSIRFLLSKMFWEEIRFTREKYRIAVSPLIIKTALISLLQAVRYKKQIEKFLSKKNLPDGNIFVYSYWTDYRALAAALLHCDHSYLAISRAHNWDIYFERHPARYLPFRKFIFNHLNSIFFVSENGRNYSLQKVGVQYADKLHVAPLGIEQQEPSPSEAESVFTIVSCSRLVHVKRVHLIVDVLKHLAEFPVRWIHFGSGLLHYEVIRHAHAELDKRKNIQIDFRGDVKQSGVLQFYRSQHVDLFFLTSEYEGMPYVIIEALSFGIPVMATDVGGVNEAINNRNGFLIPKNFDPKDAAEKIAHYRNLGEGEKKKYREAAFETWREKFDASKNYPAFATKLLSLSQQ
ncbi:MAG: glycosyltransferase [Chitinophagales bacterium]